MNRVVRTYSNKKYEVDPLTGKADRIYFCRCCGLKMYEPNKGFDYRCAKCHEAQEGWS